MIQTALDFSPPPPNRPFKPSLQKVYDMLRAAGKRGVTTGEFAENYAPRFGARCLELRKLGVRIEKEHIPGRSSWRYWLKGDGE